jgi:large subunit ribosomal protein L24
MLLKKGDTVELISGKDRGKQGKIVQVFPKDERVVVEGLNLLTKNVRAKRAGEKGQQVKFNAPMPVSNMMLLCPKCGKRTRLGSHVSDDKKLRQCRKCKETFA